MKRATFASDPTRVSSAGGAPIDTGAPQVTVGIQAVPEPGTLFLFGAALIAAVCLKKLRNIPDSEARVRRCESSSTDLS